MLNGKVHATLSSSLCTLPCIVDEECVEPDHVLEVVLLQLILPEHAQPREHLGVRQRRRGQGQEAER